MSKMEIDAAWALFNEAELLHDHEEIERALDRLAVEIADRLADSNPVVLCLMGGAVVFTGRLLPRLVFPLEFDYLHATRYRDGTRGGEIEWCALPRGEINGRVILLLDDILDEGFTLAAAKAKLLELGAARVEVAVLTEKDLGHAKPIQADYVGLTLPNRYVFGMGMDAYGMWRNLPGIYALKEK